MNQLLLWITFLIVLPLPAVTIDFESLPAGTVVSNQYASQGVAFNIFDGLIGGPYYIAGEIQPASHYTFSAFSATPAQSLYLGNVHDGAAFSFVQPDSSPGATTSVSFYLAGKEAFNFFAPVTINYWGYNNTLLSSIGYPDIPQTGTIISYQNSAGICRVEIQSHVGGGVGHMMDDLTYDPVGPCQGASDPGGGTDSPEPATWMLVAPALAFFMRSRRH